VSLLTELDAFFTDHHHCGDLDAGGDGSIVWIACECGRGWRRGWTRASHLPAMTDLPYRPGMDRRRFLLTSLAGALTAPLAAEAQRRGAISRVGVLDPGPKQHLSPCLPAFQQGLRELGYVEGRNIAVEYRYAEGQPDRLPGLAAELVRLAPDVIWIHSTPTALVARRVITTIPVVIGVATDLEELGIVASLARPGGNQTGFELRVLELLGKQLELLKEALPTISRLAVLVDPTRPDHTRVTSKLEKQAGPLGVRLTRVEAGAPEAFEAAFASTVRGGSKALMIVDAALFAAHRHQLAALALRHRLPTISGGGYWAQEGILLAYGADVRDLCQRSAIYVDKILKGAKPADLPIEQPTKFELVINLKTAKALGLTLPPSLLARADQVIEQRDSRNWTSAATAFARPAEGGDRDHVPRTHLDGAGHRGTGTRGRVQPLVHQGTYPGCPALDTGLSARLNIVSWAAMDHTSTGPCTHS
jgi:putative ABC transport system substrate-binding protein